MTCTSAYAHARVLGVPGACRASWLNPGLNMLEGAARKVVGVYQILNVILSVVGVSGAGVCVCMWVDRVCDGIWYQRFGVRRICVVCEGLHT